MAARTTRFATAAVLGVLVLSGCSSSESSDKAPKPTPTTAATTLDNGTTTPGTVLRIGEVAKVRYSATAKNQSLVALKVTSIRKGKISALDDFNLDAKLKKSNVYFVTVAVKNIGAGDLSGQPLTLYGKVSAGLVVPPVEFGSTFKPCDAQPLPRGFKKPKRATVCIVMFAPKKGTITTVEFRAADNADPISWRRR
ncbi:MAG: hypothetical protein WKF76_01235 [Nocardioidaceae bacterium]